VKRQPRTPARGDAGPPPTRPLSLPARAEPVLLVVTVACILLSVTYRIFETDFWQHLAVGRAIWDTHQIPTRQLWSWPTYGAPDTTSSYSWLFRLILYPIWALSGVPGLFAWRYLATLAAFALAWRTARALGARGLPLYLAIVACALAYRQRSQVRPETLAAIYLAATILILELRRAYARDRSWWLVPLIWLWVNTHVSYFEGLLVVGIYALADLSRPRTTRPGARVRPLGPILALATVAIFLNPYGWRAVWQPFHFVLVSRTEDIYRSIGEIRPFDWRSNLRNGSPILLALWPLLQVRRLRGRPVDPAESALCVAFTAQALLSSRFIGYWAIVAAPFLARDVHEWALDRRWGPRRAHAATGAAIAATIVLGTAELTRADLPFGVGLVAESYPGAACDFIARHDIRGRAFNSFEFGGYLLWRFWPDRSRLPFIDIHQAGGPAERAAYIFAHARAEGWAALNRDYHPDFVVVRRRRVKWDGLRDFVDADTAWALVFADDAAALYVRRAAAPPGLLDRFAYSIVPGGTAALARIQHGLEDATFRARLRPELDRMIASSPLNSIASGFRATLNLAEGRLDQAAADLERSHRGDPDVPFYWERRGTIALLRGDLEAGLRWYRRQQGVERVPELDLRIARICQALGRKEEARRAYAGLVKRGEFAAEARDSLRSLEDTP
jgi:hypothetical protein